MKLIKRMLGFNSPYSWMKWLRIALLIVIIIASVAFSMELASFGFFGLIIFLIFFGPTLGIMLAVTTGIGAIVGGVRSGRKQAASFAESAAHSDELAELDRQRVKAQTLNILLRIAFALFVIGGVVLYFIRAYQNVVVTVVYMLGGIVLLFLLYSARNRARSKLNDDFKEQVVRRGLESVLADMEYDPAKRLDEALVRGTGLFAEFNVYEGNDYLAAVYNGVPFVLCDVNLRNKVEERYQDDDGDWQTRTTYHPVFRGRLMSLDFDAVSNDWVRVHDRRTHGKGAGAVETELFAFNEKFIVQAESSEQAFRMLTPEVMEGILAASERVDCPMSLAFVSDKLYIALANGDAFEATAVGDVTLSEQRERVRKEIQNILDMVEHLNIYQKK